MNSNLKILGAFESGIKTDVAEQFVQKFLKKYENVEGELYLGYPIYIDEVANRRVCVDMALVSKIGVYIINILTEPVVKYGEIQDDIYAKVETKFKKQNFLFKKRKLIFDFYTLTYSVTPIKEEEDYPLAQNVDDIMDFIEQTREEQEYGDDLYRKILSGLQEAYGINTYKERENVEEGTKAYAINQMASLIENMIVHKWKLFCRMLREFNVLEEWQVAVKQLF